jgi:hypothetical protein
MSLKGTIRCILVEDTPPNGELLLIEFATVGVAIITTINSDKSILHDISGLNDFWWVAALDRSVRRVARLGGLDSKLDDERNFVRRGATTNKYWSKIILASEVL